MARRISVLAAVVAWGYFFGVRPRLLRWGTTEEEADATLPGDELIPRPDNSSTMAGNLPGSPEEVWPWLVQMGCDRAGWYSWDRLDNGGRASATVIVPEWQQLAVGDRLTSTPDGSAYFTAAVVNAPQVLILKADLGLPSGEPITPGADPPRWWIRATWALVLHRTEDGQTRLVVRLRSIGNPARAVHLANALVGEPAHALMQMRQFQGLRQRLTYSDAPH